MGENALVIATLVTDWLTAVGTVGAFLAAVIIYGTDRWVTHRERREAQARVVDAWVARADWQTDAEGILFVKTIVCISNDSAQSVRSADVGFAYDDRSTQILFNIGTVPPTAHGGPVRKECQLPPPPGATPPSWTSAHLIGTIRLSLSFRDTTGLWWDRGPRGELTCRKRHGPSRFVAKVLRKLRGTLGRDGS